MCRGLTLLLEDVSVVRGLSLPKLGGRTIYPWVQVGVRSHPPSIVNQDSPIRATAPPNLLMPSSARRKFKQASNLLPLHQPQEISVARLTNSLSCLWIRSDGERVHAGHMQARSLARQCSTPGSSVPRTSTRRIPSRVCRLPVSQVALCRVLAAKGFDGRRYLCENHNYVCLGGGGLMVSHTSYLAGRRAYIP